ncbi:MAG: hypothetical protein JSR98_20025 [Proteobacteria bacterium]|nr:hypothetical protein [Pseudomonadota bacterium]
MGDTPSTGEESVLETPTTPETGDASRTTDIRFLARLNGRVNEAAILVSVALANSGIADFHPTAMSTPSVAGVSSWPRAVVEGSLQRLGELRNAFQQPWLPVGDQDGLIREAFVLLAGLTPTPALLIDFFDSDPDDARQALDAYLAILEGQVRLVARLAARDDRKMPTVASAAVPSDVLAEAGELLSLSQAAKRLGLTRQALHTRVKKRQVLALMQRKNLLLPAFQFVSHGSQIAVVEGLKDVIAPFLKSGGADAVAALRFLQTYHTELGATPANALRQGRRTEVVRAAVRTAAGDDG